MKPWESATFDELLPYIVAGKYDRDGSAREPRRRLDLRHGAPELVVTKALAWSGPCVHCGTRIHYVRQRAGSTRSYYLAVTCELGQRIGCSRGAEARDAYAIIAAAVDRYTERHGDSRPQQEAMPL